MKQHEFPHGRTPGTAGVTPATKDQEFE